MFESQAAHPFFLVADDQQPGATAIKLRDIFCGMFRSAENPQAGLFGDSHGASQIRDDREWDVLDATSGHVVDRAVHWG